MLDMVVIMKNRIRNIAGKLHEHGYDCSLKIRGFMDGDVRMYGRQVYVNGEYISLLSDASLCSLFIRIKTSLEIILRFIEKDIEKRSEIM